MALRMRQPAQGRRVTVEDVKLEALVQRSKIVERRYSLPSTYD
jgi:hypothetical protein